MNGSALGPRLRRLAIGCVVILFTWMAARDTGISVAGLIGGWRQAADLLVSMFPPNWSFLARAWQPLCETAQMAVAGTSLGIVIAIPVSLLAARNVTPNPLLRIPARLLMSLLRTMPDMLIAAIAVAALGIGLLPGVVTLTFFCFGLYVKFASETIESIDPGPVAALAAAGARPLSVVSFAIFPQIIPQLSSYAVYALELNIRAAAVVGLVGAGGIGHLFEVTRSTFRYPELAALLVVVLVIIMLLDQVGLWLRRRLV